MKIHFCGKYNGDEKTLPHKESFDDVLIKTPPSKFVYSLVYKLVLICFFCIPFSLMVKESLMKSVLQIVLGIVCGYLSLYLHELLHALCFKKNVFCYFNFIKGNAFVIGTEDMTRSRYIMTCMLPNFILGIVPYSIFLVFSNYVFLGIYGIVCLITGYNDFRNIYNTLKYIPKNSTIYLSGLNAYYKKR